MVIRTELYCRNNVLAINGLALPVLTYSFGVIHWRTTDSSLIGEPGSSSPCTVSTILRQTWTDYMLLAMKEVEACSRSRQCTSLALISVIVPIRICSLYMSVTLGDPGTRSRAWLVALLHSCGGIWLRTTRRRACTEVGPWHLTVSSSKRLRWMRNISECATVLFVCGHGAGNLCTVSIAVSLSSLLLIRKRPLVG